MDYLTTTVLGNEVWRWLVLAAVATAVLLTGQILAIFLGRRAKAGRSPDEADVPELLLLALRGPVRVLSLAGAMYAMGAFMHYARPDGTLQLLNDFPFWLNLCRLLSVLAGGWFVYQLVIVAEHLLTRWAARRGGEPLMDVQLVTVLRKALQTAVIIMTLLFAATNIFKWDIGAILAGFGLGGLAFALAAREMLANLFGSVTIFSDRPFRLGDRVVIKGFDGRVEDVGLRSTRLRTAGSELVVIPNSVVANETIQNVTSRQFIYNSFDLPLAAPATAQDVQRAIATIEQALGERASQLSTAWPARVYISKMALPAVTLTVHYWFVPADTWKHARFFHELSLDVLRRLG